MCGYTLFSRHSLPTLLHVTSSTPTVCYPCTSLSPRIIPCMKLPVCIFCALQTEDSIPTLPYKRDSEIPSYNIKIDDIISHDL
jgi:hypothetical protein